MSEEYFMQYAICGCRNGKWYREHPNCPTLEIAKQHLITEKHKLRCYDKLKIQCRKITKWEDVLEE